MIDAKFGKLTVQKDFLFIVLGKPGLKMIDPTAKLSVSREASVPGIWRGSVCYQPRPLSVEELKLMHRIDKLHMEFPFAGGRMLQGLLLRVGF